MINVVVLIYSKKGGTLQLAEEICKGIGSVSGVESRLRRVDELKNRSVQQRLNEKYEKIQNFNRWEASSGRSESRIDFWKI